MMALPFTASCQRGHDPIEFTEREPFERHMTQEHKAHRLATGGRGFTGDYGSEFGSLKAAHGFSAGKFEPYPWAAPKAPKDTRKLSAVLARAATEWVNHGRGSGRHYAVTDWHTDDMVTLEDVRTGDVFELGGREYTVHDRDEWLVTMAPSGRGRNARPGTDTPRRPRNIEDRLGETVRIVKRAA
jgi:hypothetical protein